ncbi:MAG: efflux RND transporter periplasmic adaptor subunit [Luteimonas sp.]|nr:efflux RND transporter periplasmic adaptor subunit [Luteimonas sp.]
MKASSPAVFRAAAWAACFCTAFPAGAVAADAAHPPAAQAPIPSAPPARPKVPEAEVRMLVVADRESIISAPAPGRVAGINVRLGDVVRGGQVLVSLDCTEIQARREAAQAEARAARLQHEAKIKLQGLQSAAEVEVELAAANVDRSEAQTRVFDAQLAQCRFPAPFPGRVARVHVKTGQSVTAGTPIAEIVSSGPPRARINVPSKWLAWIKRGDLLEGEVDETGRRYTLRVMRISARVDAVSQTVELEADFQGRPPELLPGMSGRAFAPNR